MRLFLFVTMLLSFSNIPLWACPEVSLQNYLCIDKSEGSRIQYEAFSISNNQLNITSEGQTTTYNLPYSGVNSEGAVNISCNGDLLVETLLHKNGHTYYTNYNFKNLSLNSKVFKIIGTEAQNYPLKDDHSFKVIIADGHWTCKPNSN